jgi:glycosyltransferase involved in cell wall biosynthesis
MSHNAPFAPFAALATLATFANIAPGATGAAIAPSTIVIGVYPATHHGQVDATLQALYEHAPQPHRVLLLAEDEAGAALARARYPGVMVADGGASPASAFNGMTATLTADLYIFIEAGARCTHGALQALVAALRADPAHGLAGPSTNRAWNEQASAAPARGASAEETATALARQYGDTCRTLAPLHSLSDFCYAVKRQVVDALGAADEAYRGPGWEMDYNLRAARAGFAGLWVCGAYVERGPFSGAAMERERLWADSGKRRYQDKFCGWLRQQGSQYSNHCRGEACHHFAAAPMAVRLAPAAPATAVAAPIAQTPLVSCIMPTRGRPAFVARSITYFLRQDYSARELLIVYEQESDIAPRVEHGAIRYLHAPAGTSIGAKRNEAVRQARGDIIAQWDDDDWYARTRLSRQLAPILANAADITGLNDILFLQLPVQQYWRVSRDLFRRMFSENVCGGSLVYRRSVWLRAGPYPSSSLREDADFLAAALRHGARPCRLNGRDQFTYIRHDMNTWKFAEGRFLQPEAWHAEGAPPWMDADHALYATLAPPPLASCIMPTADRHAFVAQAIAHFLRQDYAHKELIIVDDGVHPVADLVHAHPAIHYLRLPHRASIGAKRNLACERANGDLIVHWDDDDWMAPDWISSQVRSLRQSGADLVGLDRILFYAPALRRAWQYVYDGARPWVCGGTMCYRRDFWQRNRFPDIDVGEDNAFVWSACAKRIALNDNGTGYIDTIHRGNTSRKDTDNQRWRRHPAQDVERLLRATLAA